jgi:hypothetical protein
MTTQDEVAAWYERNLVLYQQVGGLHILLATRAGEADKEPTEATRERLRAAALALQAVVEQAQLIPPLPVRVAAEHFSAALDFFAEAAREALTADGDDSRAVVYALMSGTGELRQSELTASAAL